MGDAGPRDQVDPMAKARILIAATDADLRATLARWLMASGYGVELAESPKRAREVVATEPIALAIVAPHGLGEDLARELGDLVGALIIIQDSTDDEAAAGAAEGSIVKPLDTIGAVDLTFLAASL
jgi:DNA-binding response OmpR family regulator